MIRSAHNILTTCCQSHAQKQHAKLARTYSPNHLVLPLHKSPPWISSELHVKRGVGGPQSRHPTSSCRVLSTPWVSPPFLITPIGFQARHPGDLQGSQLHRGKPVKAGRRPAAGHPGFGVIFYR